MHCNSTYLSLREKSEGAQVFKATGRSLDQVVKVINFLANMKELGSDKPMSVTDLQNIFRIQFLANIQKLQCRTYIAV
jgi:hypothetical protein